MTSKRVSVQNTRSSLVAELFGLLKPSPKTTSESAQRQCRALGLIEALASPADVAALEDIIRDETRDLCVRHAALQSLFGAGCEPSDALIHWVFSKSAALGQGNGCHHYAWLLMAAHRKSLDMTQGIARLSMTIVRSSLIRPMGDMPFSMRLALYRRCFDAGELDLELALQTVEFPESRAVVISAFPSETVMSTISSPLRYSGDLRFLQVAHPERMAQAFASFQFGVYRTLEFFGNREAYRRAREFLAHAQGSGPRVRSAADVLAQAPLELDALLECPDLDDDVYSVLVWRRVACELPAQYDVLFRQLVNPDLLSSYTRLSSSFVSWALRSGPAPVRQRALRQLLQVEPCASEAADFESDTDGMMRVLALGAAAAGGSTLAVEQLLATIKSPAIPVLWRAQAIRSLRSLDFKPKGWAALMLGMLENDTHQSERCPVRGEAVVALSRPFFPDGRLAMRALVNAVVDGSWNEPWCAIVALRTWTHEVTRRIEPWRWNLR